MRSTPGKPCSTVRPSRSAPDGTPRFELLQRHEVPVTYVIFDVLSIDGNETMDLPYEHRRRLLLDLVTPGDHWIVPAHHVGGGRDLLEAARERSLEGVMAKRLGSTYQPGKRSPAWRKVKVRREQEMVIGGWTPGAGNRDGVFGSLLLGYYEGDSLRLRRRRRDGIRPQVAGVAAAPVGRAGRPRSARTIRRPRRRYAATRTGCGPSWCARSRSPNGRSTAWSARPASSGCATTRTRATSCASPTPPVSPEHSRRSHARCPSYSAIHRVEYAEGSGVSGPCGRSRRPGSRRRAPPPAPARTPRSAATTSCAMRSPRRTSYAASGSMLTSTTLSSSR